MWFGDVDIPDPLVDAQGEGTLVVFAGAGASIPSPSGLPSFEDLVAKIEGEAKALRREGEPLDRYLGRLKEYPVHQRVAELISDPGSRPSSVHSAVLALFPHPQTLRLVTTNFDRHFSTAAAERWPAQVEEYFAPALPPGDLFSGIVYLHGTATGDPARLIVTDGDFGQAYLTRGWARRFLSELFGSRDRTVLFIGYRHEDTVLHYLARGLAPGGNRFALTTDDHVDHWRDLGVEPVVYPPVEGDPHAAVVISLEEWGRYSGLGLGDQSDEVRRIVAVGPNADRTSLDYLRARIRDPETVAFFTGSAGPEWLEWLEDEPSFRALFVTASGDDADPGRALAWWFGDKVAATEPETALAVVARLGARLAPSLWQSVAWALKTHRPDPEVLLPWLEMLFWSVPERTNNTLDYLLHETPADRVSSEGLRLFEFLTEPQARLQTFPGVFSEDGRERTTVELWVRGDDYWLDESWRNVLVPRVPELAHQLLADVTKHLDRARRLSAFDAVSFRRSAIEPHDQDAQGLRYWADVLIDAARECLEWLIANDPDTARAYLSLWASSDSGILVRLAVHGVGAANWLTPDDRLRWLVERNLVFDVVAHHEVYRLLAAAYPAATAAARAELIVAVDAGPQAPAFRDRPDLRLHSVHDLLTWLSERAPDDELVTTRLDPIREAHPDLRLSPHPDLLSWSGPIHPAGREGGFAVDDLLAGDVADAAFLERLITHGAEERAGQTGSWFDSPRRGLLEAATAAGEREPEWSLQLARALAERGAWDSDLWEAAIESWSRGRLSEDEWSLGLDLLDRNHAKVLHAAPIARLLENAVRATPPTIPSALMPMAFAIARSLWEALRTRAEDADQEEVSRDWLSTAINDPAGQLAMYFLHALSIETTQTGATGLQDPYRELFDTMVLGSSRSDHLARSVLASQLHFLHNLDRAWAAGSLIPAMDWERGAATALPAWDGFLTWGRLPPALAADLLPSYRSIFSHTGELGRLRDQFASHLSFIAFLPSVNPEDWLTEFVATAEAEDVESWTSHVAARLRKLPADAREQGWGRWIEKYWILRNQGVPRVASEGELRQLVGWALELPEHQDEACRLAIGGRPAGAPRLFFHRLAEGDWVRAYPATAAILLRHVLAGSNLPFWECPDALSALTELSGNPNAPRDAVADAVDHLIRLRCPGAVELRVHLRSDEGQG